MKNPPCQKAWRVSEELTSVNSTSSLAVFYVEQVALNRHVMPLSRLLCLCYISKPLVNREVAEKMGSQQFAPLLRQRIRCSNTSSETRPDGQLTSRRIKE